MSGILTGLDYYSRGVPACRALAEDIVKGYAKKLNRQRMLCLQGIKIKKAQFCLLYRKHRMCTDIFLLKFRALLQRD
jgi:hypothetical protein